MSKTTCPVFRPTMEEFVDFRSYIETISSAASAGICKQLVSGRAGVFEVNLFETKPMTVRELFEFAERNSLYEESYEIRERKFWRSLASPCDWDDPIYGADVLGTLFDGEAASGWNVNQLDSVLRLLGASVPGVNCSYLYYGTWRAMFAYHTEDLDLLSINYIHSGAAKSWYAVPLSARKMFESMATSFFPADSLVCSEFLRHKTKLLSPSKLKDSGIPYHTVVQEEGEFVITFPGSYHAGFNHGFNIAESTNFAASIWFEVGRKAKVCNCRPWSVRLNVDFIETLYLRDLRNKSAAALAVTAAPAKISPESAGARVSKGAASKSSSVSGRPRRLRCCCGEKQTKASSSEAETSSIMCLSCGLYFHPDCSIRYQEATLQIEAGTGAKQCMTNTCHLCFNIESGLNSATAAFPDKVKVPDDISLQDSKEDDGGSSSDESCPSSPKPSKRKVRDDASRPQRLKTQIDVCQISVGMPVQGSADMLTGLPGVATISDIEDGWCRVHTKGAKKAQDSWIRLEDVIPLSNHGEPALLQLTTTTSSRKRQIISKEDPNPKSYREVSDERPEKTAASETFASSVHTLKRTPAKDDREEITLGPCLLSLPSFESPDQLLQKHISDIVSALKEMKESRSVTDLTHLSPIWTSVAFIARPPSDTKEHGSVSTQLRKLCCDVKGFSELSAFCASLLTHCLLEEEEGEGEGEGERKTSKTVPLYNTKAMSLIFMKLASRCMVLDPHIAHHFIRR